MKAPGFSLLPVLLLAAAVAVFPRNVLAEGECIGSDFAVKVDGFRLQDLQQERVCRPPTVMPTALVAPLAPSTPPPAPYAGSKFDVAVVIQRHGTRRSVLGDATPTPFYGKTHPGQLLPQGAYELHVAGIEMRWYLMDALGLWSSATNVPEPSSSSADDVYRRTLGLDLTDECRKNDVMPQLCTLSNLVFSVGNHIPAEAVYARSSALPRTQWSGLMFLQGFYGLPFGCLGTVKELVKTAGSGAVDVCLQRTACDNSGEEMELTDTVREECTSRRLPCIHTPPLEEDGLMCGVKLSKKAYGDAIAYYTSRGVNRTYEPRDPKIREALDIALKVWGEEILGKGSSWMAGDMAFSERAAGATTPLGSLVTWVEEEKRKCEDPAAGCKPEEVRTYESLLGDILNAFREGRNVRYADGAFGRYVASPAVALQNALFRVKAFGRAEDWQHLKEMLYLIGGFEGLEQEAAVEKLKMLVINFHDFLLLALRELLGMQDSEVMPFGERLTFELSHSEAGTALRGARAKEGTGGLEKTGSDHRCGCGCKGGAASASPEQRSWPESPYFVRVLVGTPGRKLEPVALPWCDNAVACPLHKWLSYTYGKVNGHWFYDVASNFRQKFAKAREAVGGGSVASAS